MYFRRIIILVLIISPFLTPKLHAENQVIDDNIILQAIAQVESNGQYWRIGKHREKTKYQFVESTWYQYSDVPFFFIEQGHYEKESDVVAYKHLAKIKQFLSARNQCSVKNIAFIWNAGFGAYKRGKLPNSTKRYMQKVEKQYYLLINSLPEKSL